MALEEYALSVVSRVSYRMTPAVQDTHCLWVCLCVHVKTNTPKDSRHILLTRGMVFPDLNKVFFTARGILKVKVFKMDGEIVS